jgi:ankyrin repeat protein
MSDTDPRTEFAAALRDDRVDDARLLLLRHPNLRAGLNEPVPGGAFGAKPLLVAVQRKNREMVDLLVSAGADINGKSDWWAGGFGLLEGCDADFAPFLIERGATIYPNAAAKLGMLDALRSLIAADPAAARARGGDGQTPLHMAATVEIAQVLLDAGAEIDALDVDHESTPAQYAIGERTDVARVLVSRGAQADILLASALGDVDRVRRILDADPAAIGVAVDAEHFPMRNPRAGGHIYSWTLGRCKIAHTIARDFRHADVVDLLVSRTPNGLALAIALREGDDATAARLLVAHPGLVASLTPTEQRFLINAAQVNDDAAVRRMLRAGWPVNVPALGGATALHWASFLGNAELARELIARGAAVDARDTRFKGAPIDWTMQGSVHSWRCAEGDFAAVVRALLAAGSPPPDLSGSLKLPRSVLDALRDQSAI